MRARRRVLRPAKIGERWTEWPWRVRRAMGAAMTCLRASAPGGSAQDTPLGRVFRGGHEDAWRYMLRFAADRRWGEGEKKERPHKRARGGATD